MREVACNSFGSALRQEWSVISNGRWARARLRRWADDEPVLADSTSLDEVTDAIAIPIGHPQEFSSEVTRAILRLAVNDPLASRLLLQVMLPILAKECFRSLRILESERVAVDDAELVTIVLGSASEAIASLAGLHRVYPLRTLRQRTLKGVERRRDQLIVNARELATEKLPRLGFAGTLGPTSGGAGEDVASGGSQGDRVGVRREARLGQHPLGRDQLLAGRR